MSDIADIEKRTSAGRRVIEGLQQAIDGKLTRVRMQDGSTWIPEQRWLPIETAPRDGSKVLVFAPDIYGALDPVPRWTITTAWYDAEPVGSMHWCGSGLTTHFQPTKWQPLPAPPGDA
jgi:hypothetical protein